ncbi:cytidylyltransferase domain-containing protein [Kiloniella sp. b19]|uniref:cytidylyltransferase domain-containing protein n=1 Tax=Kiloniella sp. GXU_MW_B19 TaxID=3141326 RepID=UPI0031D14A66
MNSIPSTTGAIVFGRMSSSRLPGKMLMDIEGQTLSECVLARIELSIPRERIVFATSTDSSDTPLADFVASKGYRIFRGSLENVARRALDCARQHGFENWLRVCGDRPFSPWEVADRALQLHHETHADLTTTTPGKTWPAGATVEVVRTSALERILRDTTDTDDLEHVTRFFYNNVEAFRIEPVQNKTPWPKKLSLVIDTPEDLEKIRYIAGKLGTQSITAKLDEVCSLAMDWHKYQQHAKEQQD